MNSAFQVALFFFDFGKVASTGIEPKYKVSYI